MENKIRIGIISDTHIGDEDSSIISKSDLGNYYTSDKFDELKDIIFNYTGGKNIPLDYLILNGDILDFAIDSFKGACEQARPFFREIKKQNLAGQIIYIPGNHDKQIWDALEWDENVLQPMNVHKIPTDFLRKHTALVDLNNNTLTFDNGKNYSGNFIKGLFDQNDTIPMSIVYPNLYIKTKDNNVILVTHGHLLEQAWTLVSELVHGINNIPDTIDLKGYETYNIPITAMICTALGQAGELTDLLGKLEDQIYLKDYKLFDQVIDEVTKRVKDIVLDTGIPLADGLISWILKQVILHDARKSEKTKYKDKFLKNKDTQDRFGKYFETSRKEIDGSIKGNPFILPAPTTVFFGHTHEVIGAIGADDANPLDYPIPPAKPVVKLYNTGGWVKNSFQKNAAVFFIDEAGKIGGQQINI